MITVIRVRKTGPIARGMKRAHGNAVGDVWVEVGKFHHEKFTHLRFTNEHAQKAGYTKRRGQNLDPNSSQFRAQYYGRKFVSTRGGGRGRALPLVFSGDSRNIAKSVNIKGTRNGLTMSYAVNALNFKNPRSRVNMADEFRKILPNEIRADEGVFERRYDKMMARENFTTTRTIR